MNQQGPLTLELGSTGKTGSRVTKALIDRGLLVPTSARFGADVAFDWTQRDSYTPTLARYLVPPVMRLDFADDVSALLDEAEAAGVQRITFLSASGMEHAPDEVAIRNVELDLLCRKKIGHTILRPPWLMQNFSETFLGRSRRHHQRRGRPNARTRRPRPFPVGTTIVAPVGLPRTFRNFAHHNANAWRAAK